MTNTKFWKPVYQLFKPEEALSKPEDLRDFYVQRPDSPVENLVSSLEMADEPIKFLLAGHLGGGKTTELRRVQEQLAQDYAVIWIDTATALDRYNISYAEVLVLIALEICRQAIQPGWWSNKDEQLMVALEETLLTVVYQEKDQAATNLGLPDILKHTGLVLKRGLTREMTKTLNIRPKLSEMITRVNDIIREAEKDRQQKLVVIVDGLDRHDQQTALEMFASPLLTELDCHIIYTIPISLRYSPNFRQPLQSFQKCLDLANIPVFEPDENFCPTKTPNKVGRELLGRVISKRLARIQEEDIFTPDAIDLLCEKSGGVMRDLIRLARTSCEVALKKKREYVDKVTAEDAVKEERKAYTLRDYHFPELAKVHQTGRLTTNSYSLPSKGNFVICDELLQNKFVLGYYDENLHEWYDVNPILLEDVQRWEIKN
ncbi:MAG: AAA family ATPase [Symploca sp. SIO1A3]|nr:AAA family ATPase [Symploca sp. SIO1A3]